MAFFSVAKPPPNDKSSFARWVVNSILQLATYVNHGAREFVVFGPIYRVFDIPTKPQEGTLIYVGAGVLPGGQPGFHYWDGTDWTKL